MVSLRTIRFVPFTLIIRYFLTQQFTFIIYLELYYFRPIVDQVQCLVKFQGGQFPVQECVLMSMFQVFYTVTKRQSRIACIYVPANTSHAALGCMPGNLSSNLSSRRGVSPLSFNSKSSQGMSASCPTLADEYSPRSGQNLAYTGDSARTTPYTVLFSHGNAVDIGQVNSPVFFVVF